MDGCSSDEHPSIRQLAAHNSDAAKRQREMKPRVMATAAASVALMVSAAATVSANPDSAAGAELTAAPDLCTGLPRNTVLSSCPAPCVANAPCIVYDHGANFTQLTGCDYGTATPQSFCTTAATQAQTCEIHCFPPSPQKGSLAFQVRFSRSPLGQPTQRNEVENFNGGLDFYRTSYQVNNFVTVIGKLNASDAIDDVYLAGDTKSSSGIGINLGDSPPDNSFVDVNVDADVLAGVAAVKTLTLKDLPLGSDRTAQILSHAPATLSQFSALRVDLTTLPDNFFPSSSRIETVTLSNNPIEFVGSGAFALPRLRTLDLSANEIKTFEIRAPRLESLVLNNNRLVRIPPSVFTLSNLSRFFISGNLIAQPLVLSQEQVDFLGRIFSKSIDLVSPSRTSASGNAVDEDDLSQYLANATSINLFGYSWLPTLVVSSENARKYNDLLEKRAYPATSSDLVAPPSSNRPPSPPAPTNSLVPDDLCGGITRKTLFANCAGRCARDGACVLYDSDAPGDPSGCDYDVASATSYCTTFAGLARTCDFQCFPAFETPSVFKFQVPFATEEYAKIERRSFDDASFHSATTADVPFLADPFLRSIGSLNLPTVTEISISGGRSAMGTRGRVASVDVKPSLLSLVTRVTSLSLMNVDLSTSDVSGILASRTTLKSLNLRNTLLTTIPKGGLAQMQQLESLTLGQNQLTSIAAEELALPRLKNLYLSENDLTAVEIGAPNLVTLDLSQNGFVRVPSAVFSLSNLVSLNLLNNPIALPLVVSQTQLEFLISIQELMLPQPISTPASQPPLINNSTEDREVPIGSELLVNGTAQVVRGTPVIVVSQTNADRYNDLLEQQQKTSSASSSPPSASATEVPGSSSGTSAGASAGAQSSNAVSSWNGTNSSLPSATIGGSRLDPSPETSDSNIATTTALKRNRSSLVLLLVLSGLGSVLFVIIILMCVFIRRRRRGKASRGTSERTYVSMDDKARATGGAAAVAGATNDEVIPWWTDDDMLAHRLRSANISDQRVIRASGWGVVWLVDYRGGSRQLVSKRLIDGEGRAHEARVLDLFGEAKIASTLSHPSIVQFVGVAWTDKTNLQVLYEHTPNGDMGSYLAQTDASALPWLPEKLQLAIDIVEALVYAHSFNPPLLHRDLKSSNVLLDDEYRAKLGNFGSARSESDSNTMTAGDIGTGRWLAPEILLGSTSYGSSSDIYSFGVVLCELDTHEVPYASDAKDVDEGTLLQRVARDELRPSVSSTCPPGVREIAQLCLSFDPSSRPNATQVAYMLRSLMARTEESHDNAA